MIGRGHSSHHCAKGFTLIELLPTLALLATLSTVAYPLTALMGKRDRELDLQRSLRKYAVGSTPTKKPATPDVLKKVSATAVIHPPSKH